MNRLIFTGGASVFQALAHSLNKKTEKIEQKLSSTKKPPFVKLTPMNQAEHESEHAAEDSPAEDSPYEAPANDPTPVAFGAPQAPALTYPKNILLDALQYPFRGSGKLILFFAALIAGAVSAISWLPVLGWIAALIVWGMIVGLCCNTLLLSINHPQRDPEWPDFSDAASDIIAPLIRFVFVFILLLVLPTVLIAWLKAKEQLDEQWTWFFYLITYFLGSSYLAFSMLSMNLLGTFQGLLPHNIIQLFWRSMPQSWYILPLLFLLTVAYISTEFLSAINIFLPYLLIAPINVYFFLVIARFLGRLYGVKQAKIGWF